MEQVERVIDGQRDYSKIRGGTGPLVYPAAHVYIYRALYALTDHGRDILTAQLLFAVLYLCTLALVMACYRRAKVSEHPNVEEYTCPCHGVGLSVMVLRRGTAICLSPPGPFEAIT